MKVRSPSNLQTNVPTVTNVTTLISNHVQRGIIALEEATYKKKGPVLLGTSNPKLVHKDVYLASEEATVR